MADSSNNITLFQAVVKGDLAYLESMPSDTDWNRNFTFQMSNCCLCSVKIERFLETPEVMLSEFEETIRTGMCPHCKGGPKAPASSAEKQQFLTTLMDDSYWDIDFYVSQTWGNGISNTGGANPLHLATMLNHKEIVTWLAEKPGVDLHAKTERLKEPPLNQAVYKGDKAMVDHLLRLGANPKESGDNSNDTPAILAVQTNKPEILDLLIQHGADINQSGAYVETPINLAVTEHKKECVELLVKAGVDTRFAEPQEETVLNYAVKKDPEIVKILLKGNVDVNEVSKPDSSYPPLITAISRGKLDIAKLLLEHGADVNIALPDDHCVLQIAAYANIPGAVDLLLQFGADVNHVNKHLYSALHHASWDGYVDICQKLLAAGAKYDSQTKDKNTPLSLACHGNRLETIKMFLSQYSCNVNNKDKDSDTPLHYTTFNGCLESTKLLISKGADPAAENSARATPLWNAIYTQHKDIVKLLLEKNVCVDIPSLGIDQLAQSNDVSYIYNSPKSPLYVAAEKNLLNVPTMLVLSGLDLTQERWLHSGGYPANLREDNVDIDNEMVQELYKISHSVLSLKEIARCNIRRILGLDLPKLVPTLEIPHSLVNYLMLKHW